MNRKRMNSCLITLIVLFLVLGCKQTDPSSKGPTNKTEEPITVFAVSTTVAVQGEIKDYLPSNKWSLIGRILQQINKKFEKYPYKTVC